MQSTECGFRGVAVTPHVSLSEVKRRTENVLADEKCKKITERYLRSRAEQLSRGTPRADNGYRGARSEFFDFPAFERFMI